MTKSSIKSKSGFTIIEVVLVLAIAGLIFLMVFLALPALQRSQRDTQRSRDVDRLQTALHNYQTNNRGALPTATSASLEVAGHDKPAASVPALGSWGYFYDKYLLVGDAGQTDVFADPDGTPYTLEVKSCKDSSATCKEQRNNKTFDSQNHKILILSNAVCQGEVATHSSGARKVAMLYKKEGGGVICVNN